MAVAVTWRWGACKCGGNTVFERAIVGQVFTGHVTVICPIAAEKNTRDEGVAVAPKKPPSPVLVALVIVAIWQILAPLARESIDFGKEISSALLFLLAGRVVHVATTVRLARIVK